MLRKASTHADEIDDVIDHLDALERRARDLARAANGAERDRSGWSASAAHGTARLIRAAARRFPLLALAGAFGLGLYVGSRPER